MGAVAVIVLAAPDAGLALGVALGEAGDVDEHAVADVDPAGVDDVLARLARAVGVVRVDVEHVRLDALDARLLVDVAVLVHGAVQVRAQVEQRRRGHLYVQVVVPRHDAPVPPPPQQRPVRQPRLDAQVLEHGQVRPDQVPQRRPVLFVRHLALEVADVVVAQLQRAAGLVEVLGLRDAVGHTYRRPAVLDARRGGRDGRGEDGGEEQQRLQGERCEEPHGSGGWAARLLCAQQQQQQISLPMTCRPISLRFYGSEGL